MGGFVRTVSGVILSPITMRIEPAFSTACQQKNGTTSKVPFYSCPSCRQSKCVLLFQSYNWCVHVTSCSTFCVVFCMFITPFLVASFFKTVKLIKAVDLGK